MHTLYLCATPIGNLEDVSLRLLRVLKEVSLIACEDTRHSSRLLRHYDIHKPLLSYHEHNRRRAGESILQHLMEEGDVALLSDAGMPGISDPGVDLVVACQEAGITVTVIPGPSAGLTALVLSGFDTSRYVFEGFLPRRASSRQTRLKELIDEKRTIVLYEAPHRLKDILEDCNAVGINRRIALCRELSKRFEEVRIDTAEGHLSHYEGKDVRGEFVLVIEGAAPTLSSFADALTAARHCQAQGLGTKAAAKAAAAEHPGIKSRDLYRALIEE